MGSVLYHGYCPMGAAEADAGPGYTLILPSESSMITAQQQLQSSMCVYTECIQTQFRV